MLPRKYRLTESDDFLKARQQGVRAGNRFVAVTVAVSAQDTAISHTEKLLAPKVGFVVPKRELPRAVDRNRVKRQLRELLRTRIRQYPPGTLITIRAFSAAKGKNSQFLAEQLDQALLRAATKLARQKVKQSEPGF